MSPTMYIVTDQKSLSSNVTIEPHNDAEGVSSSRSAPFSPSGWNTWLEGHSKSTPTIAASDNNDIEMTAISPLQHDTAPSSDNAYKSIMTDIPYSTLDASSTPNSPAQYCIVCLSRPVDSVIQDCGHSTCCLSCLISITVKSSSHHRPPTHQSTLANGSALQPPLGHCPMCRTGITTILQLKDAPFQVKDQKMAAISHVQYQVKHRQDVEEMELEPETDQDQEAVDRSYLHSTPSLLDVII